MRPAADRELGSAGGRARIERVHERLDSLEEAVAQELRLQSALERRLDAVVQLLAEQVETVVSDPFEEKDD